MDSWGWVDIECWRVAHYLGEMLRECKTMVEGEWMVGGSLHIIVDGWDLGRMSNESFSTTFILRREWLEEEWDQ